MSFQIGGRLYRPPSLLSEDFKARMCIASFTPLLSSGGGGGEGEGGGGSLRDSVSVPGRL